MNKKFVYVISGIHSGSYYSSEEYTDYFEDFIILTNKDFAAIHKEHCIFFDTKEQLENYIYLQ